MMIPGILAQRRHGGGGPVLWTPAQLSTAAWFDGDDAGTITLDSGAVSQWADKSGNARHASQATASNRPSVAAGVMNGRDVIRFDGFSDFLATASFFGPAGSLGVTLAMVLNKTAEPVNYSNPITKGLTNSEWSIVMSSNSTAITDTTMRRRIFWRHTTGANQTVRLDTAYGLDGPIIFTGTMRDSGIAAWRSGSPDGTATSASKTLNQNTPLRIGDSSDFHANRFQGDIAEVVLIHSVPTPEDRQKLEGYLAHKWGLAALLPSDHPYKSSAPTV